MKMRSVTPMRIAKTGYIVMSIVFSVIGVLLIAMPDISAKVIGLSVGIAMIVFGAVRLVGYFSKDLFRLAFQFDLGFGILMLALGVIVLTKPENLMTFLGVALGISVLIDSLFKIQIALDSKQFGIKSWWLIFSMAIITGIMGLILITHSAVGAQLLTILLGISFIIEGVLNLCTVVNTVLIVKNQKPDVIDVDYINIK